MVSACLNAGGLAYPRSGYPEDGLNSGIRVARDLGVTW